MCTLSLVPSENKNGFILTSNRDEASDRKTLPPDFLEYKGARLLFPKDVIAGGTWIGISEHKRVLCLLNGGFVKHKREKSYKMSRGIIVKDWLAVKNIDKTIKEYSLKNIEPFTLIIADWGENLKFMELVWDGTKKHYKELPAEKSHLWSSSPLYTPKMKKLRESWYENFRRENVQSPQNLWKFHHNAGKDDKNVGLIMDREVVKTQSISQIISSEGKCDMIYEDLNTSEVYKYEFCF